MFLARKAGFAIAILMGVLFSQLPEYAQQYRQRLGGAIDELKSVLADFDRDAASRNLSRSEGIRRLADNADSFAQQRARRIREMEVRTVRLERQLKDFREAGAFRRMVVLARDFDGRIAARAYEAYEPAVPTTSEGLVTAGAGFLGTLVIWRMAGFPLRRRRRRILVEGERS